MANPESELLQSRVWDQKRLHEYFLHQARERERYLKELMGKLNQSSAYQSIYDQTLAEFYVFNHFHGRTFLASREEFLHALGDLEVASIPRDDYFDRTRFAEHRLRIIRNLQSAAATAVDPIE